MNPGELQQRAAQARERGEIGADFEDGVEFARRVLEGQQRERNMFAEAEVRMQRDPEFRAVVEMLGMLAMKHGFTPYELKQIGFSAALWVAQRVDRSHAFANPQRTRGY